MPEAKKEISIKDLLKKLSGRKIELTTMDGRFNKETGFVKDVFEDFFTFITIEEKFADRETTRHWIPIHNIGTISEYNKKGFPEKVEIER